MSYILHYHLFFQCLLNLNLSLIIISIEQLNFTNMSLDPIVCLKQLKSLRQTKCIYLIRVYDLIMTLRSEPSYHGFRSCKDLSHLSLETLVVT